MNLSIFKPKQPAVAAEAAQQATEQRIDLEELLTDMQRYGKPRLHCHDDNTWSCAIDVSVSPVGAKFEVRSDFKQTSPSSAAQQCNERLIAAITSLKGPQ